MSNDFEYLHKKTGNLYVMLSQAVDCTNARDGTPVVVYAPKGDMARVFVRDEAEFEQKFERVGGKKYRDDGWYWVRKKGWRDEYGEWVPALWQTEYRSWRSAAFSGIPDSEMIVGDKMVTPNV